MHPEITPAIEEELRAKLEARRVELQATIASLRADENTTGTPLADPNLDAPGDEGDASMDLQEWDENHQEELDLNTQLDEVIHALNKFTLDTYGLCETCGEPIPLARLRAIPEARYDIAHQAEIEAQAG